jgi:hypothetical protein
MKLKINEKTNISNFDRYDSALKKCSRIYPGTKEIQTKVIMISRKKTSNDSDITTRRKMGITSNMMFVMFLFTLIIGILISYSQSTNIVVIIANKTRK